jgi:hypothetical protein
MGMHPLIPIIRRHPAAAHKLRFGNLQNFDEPDQFETRVGSDARKCGIDCVRQKQTK